MSEPTTPAPEDKPEPAAATPPPEQVPAYVMPYPPGVPTQVLAVPQPSRRAPWWHYLLASLIGLIVGGLLGGGIAVLVDNGHPGPRPGVVRKMPAPGYGGRGYGPGMPRPRGRGVLPRPSVAPRTAPRAAPTTAPTA